MIITPFSCHGLCGFALLTLLVVLMVDGMDHQLATGDEHMLKHYCEIFSIDRKPRHHHKRSFSDLPTCFCVDQCLNTGLMALVYPLDQIDQDCNQTILWYNMVQCVDGCFRPSMHSLNSGTIASMQKLSLGSSTYLTLVKRTAGRISKDHHSADDAKVPKAIELQFYQEMTGAGLLDGSYQVIVKQMTAALEEEIRLIEANPIDDDDSEYTMVVGGPIGEGDVCYERILKPFVLLTQQHSNIGPAALAIHNFGATLERVWLCRRTITCVQTLAYQVGTAHHSSSSIEDQPNKDLLVKDYWKMYLCARKAFLRDDPMRSK